MNEPRYEVTNDYRVAARWLADGIPFEEQSTASGVWAWADSGGMYMLPTGFGWSFRRDTSSSGRPQRREVHVQIQRARIGDVSFNVGQGGRMTEHLRLWYEFGTSNQIEVSRSGFLTELRLALLVTPSRPLLDRHVRVVIVGNHTVLSIGHPEEDRWADGPGAQSPQSLAKCAEYRKLLSDFAVGAKLITTE